MNWRNVKLIYQREIRDQLRDRRTLFMIGVLPLLLYPLLGMSVFQLSQFMRKHDAVVLVVGSEQLSTVNQLPTLFEDGHFAGELAGDPSANDRIRVQVADGDALPEPALAQAKADLAAGAADVVLWFPPDFADQLLKLKQELSDERVPGDARDPSPGQLLDIPQPGIVFNSARDESRVTHMRVERILERWRASVVRQMLLRSRVPVNVAKPFLIQPMDMAEKSERDAVVWSKILPFVLFIWALTGAFYPAVDLCAGEKERGTLETLLSSPALRTEIVWGKLLTVMTFSCVTALLNLISLGVTAQYVISQLRSIMAIGGDGGLSLPPVASLIWLVAALLPIAALFSALCLACAAFARSTKEGQYYLMPLLLVMMPLMLLPMSPGVELNLGNSLIPVTGLVLLVRWLIEGHYWEALPFVLPVVGVTMICCLLSIRWAVEQFQQESVLFSESERFDLRQWIVHLVRDRQNTPVAAEAFACVALILVIQFFVQLAISTHVPAQPDFSYLMLVIFISQVVCIALPAMLMTLFLTGSPAQTLSLDRWPSLAACVAAVCLAGLLHPVGQQLAVGINRLYPVSDDVVTSSQTMMQLLELAPYAWLPFALLALLPAICEELAFRGFILAGLRHLGHKWWAIGLSALFFGVAHTVLQQSLSAALLGIVIGYLAVQAGSLIPCILFHATYNGVMLFVAQWPELPELILDRFPWARFAIADVPPGQLAYRWPLVAGCGLLAAMILVWLQRLPYHRTREEELEELRNRHAHPAKAPAGSG